MTDRDIYAHFRMRVMDYQDAAHELTDGDTPDHILLSEEMWNFLDESHKFEQLADGKMLESGFLGMNVWKCEALDNHNRVALLLSDKAFQQIAPTPSDYKLGE